MENQINLLCVLESYENTPDLLANIFTEAAIAALDSINEQVLFIFFYTLMRMTNSLYFSKGWKNTAKNLEKYCSETSKKSAQRVGKVLLSLIRKRYPKGKDSICFDELLDWGLWSSYIRIYCKQ